MVRIRKPKLPNRLIARLSEEQIAKVLEGTEHTQSPERNLALLMLMVNNGLRRGEVLGLTIDNVHFDENRIRVTGKGRKDRDVPLGNASISALRAWLAVRPISLIPNVFINADGSAFQAAGLRSLFQRLQVYASLKRLYPHLLRHTFAKLYLKRVRDVKSLQQILGHAKSSTTLDQYVEYDFDDLSTLHRDGSPVEAIKKAQET
jgi:site-specific recombinase XerD